MRLVERAEKAPTDSKDTALLMRAGDVLQRGNYLPQDSLRAAEFYVRAWRAGNKYAAYKLVDVYRYLKDWRRTWFWENRSRNLDTDRRSHFSSDEISEIQRLASDSSRSNL